MRGRALLAAVLVLAAGCASRPTGHAADWSDPWSQVVDEGRLRVQLSGSIGICQDFSRYTVAESASRVVVTAYIRGSSTPACRKGGFVTLEAYGYDLSIRLGAPIGRREVVDGACGQEPLYRRNACHVQTATGPGRRRTFQHPPQ